MESVKRVLWADDEIDLLRPHIMFLEGKGYDVTAVANGDDAVDLVRDGRFDVVLLDENMPGRDGLETLAAIQEITPGLPAIMITKSEEERLMDEAIGKEIRDYLIKPVNPSQIHLALKRIFEGAVIRRSSLTRDYVKAMAETQSLLGGRLGADDWLEVGARLAYWDLQMEEIQDDGLRQTHFDQKREANDLFCRFIEANYGGWVQGGADRPLLSTDLLRESVFPLLSEGHKVAFVLIDCMRLDQWLSLTPMLEPHFEIDQHLYYSILPTATPYSRNAIFAGLFPRDIQAHHPEYWEEDPRAEGSRNKYERELLAANLERSGLSPGSWKYQRAFSAEESNQVRRQAATFGSLDFVALVFNFLDIMAHGRSESDILKELAPDEAAFRRLLTTWFERSALYETLTTLARHDIRVVITTDHGAIPVNRAAMVKAGKDASSNVRYKYGSNLKCDPKLCVHVKRPGDYMLPDEYPTKHYLFAREQSFFVYPNNFHVYERQFQGTFQHGGISLEEMVLPCSVLTPRR